MLALRRGATTAAPALLPRVSTSQIAQRGLCVNLRKADGTAQDAWFAKQEREALNKLKASLAAKKKPIDEADEKVRAQKYSCFTRAINACSALLTLLMFIARRRRCDCRRLSRPSACVSRFARS